MEEGNYQATTEGTPQGGIISPMLCNVALNGMESTIKACGKIRKRIVPSIKVVRYADDVVITGKSRTILQKCQRKLSEFLKIRGLELNEQKTRITHIKEGIDFLGFHIKRTAWSPQNQKNNQKDVLIVSPSEKGTSNLKTKIKSIIEENKTFDTIVEKINPVLRG